MRSLEKAFEKVVTRHTAGCPVKGIRWTYLSLTEIQEKLKDSGIAVCRSVLYRLLIAHHLGRRKMSKQKTMKSVEGRNEQFERIDGLKGYYLSRGWAVLSIDGKKKEYLGAFYRSGSVYSEAALPCYDHDFNSFASGRMIPQGIYDLRLNLGYLFLGSSKDTAEFNVECIRRWWFHHGKHLYRSENPILILCDGGGSNASRSHLFKEALQTLSNQTGLRFRIAHYPPYCSKYNPIEHRLFPTISRAWCGIMLDSLQTAAKLVTQRTKSLKSELKIVTTIIYKKYETGKKVSLDFWFHSNIKFDKTLRNWNYRILPYN